MFFIIRCTFHLRSGSEGRGGSPRDRHRPVLLPPAGAVREAEAGAAEVVAALAGAAAVWRRASAPGASSQPRAVHWGPRPQVCFGCLGAPFWCIVII